jgi:hypothetical protein
MTGLVSHGVEPKVVNLTLTYGESLKVYGVQARLMLMAWLSSKE